MPKKSASEFDSDSDEEFMGEPVVEREPVLAAEPVADSTPSLFAVEELVAVSEKITGMPHYFAAAAADNAGWKNGDKVSREEFIKAVEAYKEVGAF